MRTADRAWGAELACAAAWPPDHSRRVGAWLVHRSAGRSRRINAASPAHPRASLDEATIDDVAATLAAAGRPALFRVPHFLPGADRTLDRAGFASAEAETRTLCAPLRARQRECAPSHARQRDGSHAVLLDGTPGTAWLEARRRLADLGQADAMAEARRLETLVGTAAFAMIVRDHRPVSIGYAARAGRWIVLEAIATDAGWRGRGMARALAGTLMDWGDRAGADAACLQVLVGNISAERLYAGLGFGRELYRYHYRRASSSDAADPVEAPDAAHSGRPSRSATFDLPGNHVVTDRP